MGNRFWSPFIYASLMLLVEVVCLKAVCIIDNSFLCTDILKGKEKDKDGVCLKLFFQMKAFLGFKWDTKSNVKVLQFSNSNSRVW